MAEKKGKGKEDSGSGLLGLLVAGAAVGAAAGVAYGVKKLFDSMSSDTRENSYSYEGGGASGKCADYFEDNSDSDEEVEPSSGSGIASGYPLALKDALSGTAGMTLKGKLDQYYRFYVDIAPAEMHAAQCVVDEVVEQLQDHLQMTWPEWNIGDLKQVGSSTEGLKVIAPNEFDFMIPIGLDPSAWELVNGGNTQHRAPGFWLLKKIDESLATPLDKYLQEKYLSPAKMRSAFQQALQKMVNRNRTPYTIKTSVHGPSVTLAVEFGHLEDQERSLSIDFVPTVSIFRRGRQGSMQKVKIVGKPHPLSLRGKDDFNTLWRRSYSQEEGQKLGNFSMHESCHAKCLKILKAVRQHSSRIGMLSSYHMKTVLLHQMDQCSEAEWSHTELSERFIDMVIALQSYLEKRNLPHFFNPEVNLLSEYGQQSLYDLEMYLKRVVRKNDFESLLTPN